MTIQQAKSTLWCNLHVGRKTSSCFHDVLVRRESASPDALVKRFMGYTDSTTTSSMQRGIEHERVVVQDDVCKMVSDGHEGFSYKLCDLTMPSLSFLRASADGVVTDPTAGVTN